MSDSEGPSGDIRRAFIILFIVLSHLDSRAIGALPLVCPDEGPSTGEFFQLSDLSVIIIDFCITQNKRRCEGTM